jgi:hypothetical protein
VQFCAGLPGPVRVAYETGPTGFGLARALEPIGTVVAGALPVAGGARALGYSAEVRFYPWAKARGVGVNLYKGGSRRAVEWHRFKRQGRMIYRPNYDRKNVPGKKNLQHWPW